jgi:hypothetical protein
LSTSAKNAAVVAGSTFKLGWQIRNSSAGPGWTLHHLRGLALTHAAEDGTNTPILLARSRHASVRSLERYARPGPEAVARHVAEHDPARRRR